MAERRVPILMVAFVLLSSQLGWAQNCVRRDYGTSSFVCVCNATHCDTAPNVGALAVGEAVIISSSQAEARFQPSSSRFVTNASAAITTEITVDASLRFQSVLGFGGAFTDAAGINIAKLSLPAQERLLRSYYSTDGIEYGVGRVPMAGTDFSTYTYSYDDFPGDVTLSNFSLTREDTVYKIPYINWAKNMSSKPIKLFSSPWSAPAWMKTNNAFYGFGFLLDEYYQLWADYFVRFFEEYAKLGVNFWALTAQNEPEDGRIPGFSFNCMGWTPENQTIFVGQNLGPTLAAKGFGDIKIMIMDDQRNQLPKWPQTVLADPLANPYVAGIALHWYGNLYSSINNLDTTHALFPDRFIFATEACEGFGPLQQSVVMGGWERLETYAKDIIDDLNHWVTGWTDWNLALDEQGGPNWAENFVDAPIIVNNTVDEFYKQPMYYAMGHFSKYVSEDSVRIGIQEDDAQLFATAFLRPDGKRVVVLLNRSDDEKVIALNDADRGVLEFACPARSLHTVVYP